MSYLGQNHYKNAIKTTIMNFHSYDPIKHCAMQPGGGNATAEAAIGETDGRADIFYRVSRIIPHTLYFEKI